MKTVIALAAMLATQAPPPPVRSLALSVLWMAIPWSWLAIKYV